jgi:esterase/lipase superfamily enzyme
MRALALKQPPAAGRAHSGKDVRMFVVTNREVFASKSGLDAFGDRPNPKGPNELRMAEVEKSGSSWKINILPDVLPKEMAESVGLPAIDPTTGNAPFASNYVMRKILARVNPKAVGSKAAGRNLVVFVHGYNNDMKSVLDRGARLESLYGVEVLLFSWPANGGGVHGTVSYLSDKRDALASVGALDRVLAKIHAFLTSLNEDARVEIEKMADEKFPDDAERWDAFYAKAMETWCPFTLSLVLHSMGNYVLKHLLDSSVYRGDLLIFDNIVLAAADTNNEGHMAWVDKLQYRRRLFITINENDSALRASRMKFGEQQKARLGHFLADLTSRQAFYIDFTRESGVGNSHAYFEGAPTNNKRVWQFFNAALNGEFAERGLEFHAASNTYRLTARR